jgi:hypothetical protein
MYRNNRLQKFYVFPHSIPFFNVHTNYSLAGTCTAENKKNETYFGIVPAKGAE